MNWKVKLIFVLMILLVVNTITLAVINRKNEEWKPETEEIFIEPNERLVDVVWKEKSLWLLTREMKENEEAENYEFKENSSLKNGIVIHETKMTEEQYELYLQFLRFTENE